MHLWMPFVIPIPEIGSSRHSQSLSLLIQLDALAELRSDC
jgi:hypothetical protein